MQVFSSTDLNFSDSAIDHFLSSLENRGKGVGIKMELKKQDVQAMNIFLIMLTLLMMTVLFSKKMDAKFLLITAV